MGIASQKLQLLNTTGSTSTVTGSANTIAPLRTSSSDFIGVASVTENGTTIVDAKIEHAPTATGPWFTLATFTQISGSGDEQSHVPVATTSVFPFLRAVATISGGAPNADIEISLYHD